MYICFYCFCDCFCRCLPDFTLGVSDIFRKLRMCVDHAFKAEHSMRSFSPPDTVHIWPVFSLGPSAICFVSELYLYSLAIWLVPIPLSLSLLSGARDVMGRRKARERLFLPFPFPSPSALAAPPPRRARYEKTTGDESVHNLKCRKKQNCDKLLFIIRLNSCSTVRIVCSIHTFDEKSTINIKVSLITKLYIVNTREDKGAPLSSLGQ